MTATIATRQPHGASCAQSRRRTPRPGQQHALLVQTAVEPVLLMPVPEPLPLLLGLALGLMLRLRLLRRDDLTSD